MVVYNLLIPFHRSRFHHICRKRSCCCTWNLTVQHCHILFVLFDSGMNTDCLKSFRRSNAALYYLHFHPPLFPQTLSQTPCSHKHLANAAIQNRVSYGNIGAWQSPIDSSSPNIRFIFCTACPAAPFTRLSIAPIMMIRLVRKSSLKFTST